MTAQSLKPLTELGPSEKAPTQKAPYEAPPSEKAASEKTYRFEASPMTAEIPTFDSAP
jgi:hypothetical protein